MFNHGAVGESASANLSFYQQESLHRLEGCLDTTNLAVISAL